MRRASKCQQATQSRHCADLLGEECVARPGLGWCWQVGWWHATDCVGDAAVGQHQPVLWVRGVDAVCQAEMQQRAIKQLSGVIASEWPAGPIGAAHARGQANNQQFRIEAAEAGYRRIEPVRMRCTIGLSVLSESWADR